MMDVFPILWPHDYKIRRSLEAVNCPRNISWSLIEPHEEQANRNHGQTLERLAERGGLSVYEAVAVLNDKDRIVGQPADDAGIVQELFRLIREGA